MMTDYDRGRHHTHEEASNHTPIQFKPEWEIYKQFHFITKSNKLPS